MACGRRRMEGKLALAKKSALGKESEMPALPPVEEIHKILEAGGIRSSGELATGISAYLALLLRWNQKMSLTSLTNPAEILARHFGESLFGGQAAGMGAGTLLDIGSGAGFPAIPIAMASPEIHAVLLEPNLKKTVFLSEVCRNLGLENRIKIARMRLEEYEGAPGASDFITTRAVRVTPKFLALCAPLLAPGGKLVLWLGQEDADQLRQERGWVWADRVRIPGSERRFIVWGRPRGSGENVSRETQAGKRST
jgi:16S rRNA (guanine527-N7)-methyltransferase